MMRDLRPDGTIALTADDIDRRAQAFVEGRAMSLDVTGEPSAPVTAAARPGAPQDNPGISPFDDMAIPAFLKRGDPACYVRGG